ncbi:hypothetical protein VCHENC02_2115B, partial [Vibrio harveyi]
YAKY